MSDPASTDLIRFSRSPTFRDNIRYISADSRCKNVWRLSTTVPSYFPQYKGFSSFLDTETIRVISCILFHEDLSASIRHILGDIQVERLWLLGRAIDAVQAIKCRIADWATTAPALLTLADHQHELVGLGDRRTQHFDHIMWYTKAALMLANDHLPVNEQLDWSRPEFALSLYLYMKKEQAVCLCVHREGLSHASCCATLFKLYSLPIEAWRDANVSLFSDADPSARPRSELRGLMGKLEACGYPMLPPTVDHDIHSASVHPQQVPNAPKALRSGTISSRLPSTPSSTTALPSPTSTRSVAAPPSPSKQPPNAPRALMFRPPSHPGRAPTPQYGQNMIASSSGRPSAPSNDHAKWSSSTSTTPPAQHQFPPRPPNFEHPPRRYYGSSGVYVGRRLTHPLAKAVSRPEPCLTSTRERAQHSYPPLNQYIMQLHSPQPQSNGIPPAQSSASEITATFDRLQCTARNRDLTNSPPHSANTSTSTFISSFSTSILRPPANPATTEPAEYDEGQFRRVETWMDGDGGGKVYSHIRTFSSDANAVEMVSKSPESSGADMEVDDPDSHLGTILRVASDPSKQSGSEIAGDRDFPPDKNGSGGGTLKNVAPTIDSWFGRSGGATQVEEQRPTGRFGTGVGTREITFPTLDGGPAGVKSVEKTAAQIPPRGHGQKPDGLTNDGEEASEEEVWHLLPAKLGSISWWKSSKTGKVVRLFRDEPLPGHREQDNMVPEKQPGSTVDQTVVGLESGETGTGNGDRLNASEGNGRSAVVADAGDLQGAAALATQTAFPLKQAPNVSDNKKPEATTQQTPAIVIKESTAYDSSPTESPIRRSTRSSMGLLTKKSYAESSGDERARVISRSNSGSGSKGAGGQAVKQKRNEASGKVHPSATGTKASRSVPNTDKPLATVATTSSTPRPMKEMPDWEVQLREMPNWEFELEMWKERELFRYSTTGHWDDRPFNVESPQEKGWQAEVAKLRVNGSPIPANQLGYNLPWEKGIVLNLPPSTGSNPPHTSGSVDVDPDITSGNASQKVENLLITTSTLSSNPPIPIPIPIPAPVRKKANASMAKVAARPSSNLSNLPGRRMKVTEISTPTPKGPTVNGEERGSSAGLGSSTPRSLSLSKAKSMNSIRRPSTQPWTELPATQAQQSVGVIGLNDEAGNNQPNESPAKDSVDGNNRSRPTAKRKRKEDLGQDMEGAAPLRKSRKMDAASTNAKAAIHHGASSIPSNARLELEEGIVLSSEDALLMPRFRHNHHLNETTAKNPVTEASIDVLSIPADANTSLHTPLRPDLLGAGRVGKKQISVSSDERTEISQVMAVEGPIISSTTLALQGDQILQGNQAPQGTPPTMAAKKCLALRFFDSQPGRRRDDGEAEKTRLLDAISWLTDLVLDANKAEVGTEGIVFKGEYAETLVTKLDEKIPITLWRKGLRLVIELADGTTTSLGPPATQAHADVTVNRPACNTLPTGKSDLPRYPKERPIDPATHWPVLAFCASNRRMIMDEPKQEAQRIIHLLNAFCNVQLEETDWTLEEAFSRKTEDGSEIVVPRVTIVTAHAREKVFTAFSPKATKRLAKSNILIFTDDAPFLLKPEPMNFGTLRTIPPTIETEPSFVSVSIPSIHPNPVFRPHCWVSSHAAATASPLAFHTMGVYGNGTYQYCYEPLMPMNETDWGNMTRPLKFNF